MRKRRVQTGTVATALLISCMVTSASGGTEGPVEISGLFSASRRHGAGTSVELSSEAAGRLADARAAVILRGIPLADGGFDDLELQPVDPFSPDAVIQASDGRRFDPPIVSQYVGRSLTDANRDVFVSVADRRATLIMVRSPDGLMVIQPEDPAGRTSRHLVRGTSETSVVQGDEPFCGAAPSLQSGAGRTAALPSSAALARSNSVLEAKLMIDVGYDLFTNFVMQSDFAVTSTYVANLIGATSFIYQRDVNVVLKISYLHIWTSPDPFDGPTSIAQLDAYVNWLWFNRTGIVRDLNHLLKGQAGRGGVSYIDVICNTVHGTGVTNIAGGGEAFPNFDYTYNTNVFTHELGHAFGAFHTHCYSPPIDRCHRLEPGCYSGPVVSQRGETMSYCPQFFMGLGPEIKAVIRSRVEAAACMGPAPPRCGNGVIEDGEQCDDGNGTDSDCCSNACAIQNTGSACSDGFACTQNDTCDGTGKCVGTPNASLCNDNTPCTRNECLPGRGCVYTPGPPTACRNAAKSSLVIGDKLDHSKDRFTWKWTGGDATGSELGDPTASTQYSFCVMDGYGITVTGSEIAPDPSLVYWRYKTKDGAISGYSYKRNDSPSGGIKSMILNGGAPGKAKIAVGGKGSALRINNAVPPLVEPVQVWVENPDTGICWMAAYTGAQITANLAGKLKAKTP